MSNEFDQFQAWLMDMGDVLDRFMRTLPRSDAAALDSSVKSLDRVEALILSRYASVAPARAPGEAGALDGFARHVGELFRHHFGGRWKIELDDARNAFFRLPQVCGMTGRQVQLCPLTLVTTAVDRRSGAVLRTIFENDRKKQGGGPSATARS